mgnify:CR=1 FL=1
MLFRSSNIFVPCSNGSPQLLENGIYVQFTNNSGHYYEQQFTFSAKIIANVAGFRSITNPETLSILQPYYGYLKTETISDLVISTCNTEKMRITGDGSIGIQTNHPLAGLHINSNYNKILMVNEAVAGYQINPCITELSCGGYVVAWCNQISSGPDSNGNYVFDLMAQRYLSNGNKYQHNFNVAEIGRAHV